MSSRVRAASPRPAGAEYDDLRRRALAVVRRNDRLLDTLDALPDPIVVTDGQGNVRLTNGRASRLFSPADARSAGHLNAAQDNSLLFTGFAAQAIAEESDRPRELVLVDPGNGSDLLYEVLVSRLPRREDDVADTIFVLRNVTDLHRAVEEHSAEAVRARSAERRVRQESQRITAIVENVDEPILVSDVRSNIVLMNPEAERLFEAPGVSRSEACGPRQRRLRSNAVLFTGRVSDFLLGSAKRRCERLSLSDPETGRALPIEAKSTKVEDEAGEITAIVTVLRDVTPLVENEKLAEELRALNDELEDRVDRATRELEERNRLLEWQRSKLEEGSRLKSQFLANVSHELRTPINAVVGYVSLLRDDIYGELNPRQGRALERVASASDHLLSLIDEVLDLSRIESGRMPLKPQWFELRGLLDEIATTVEPMVEEKDLELHLDVPSDLPMVFSDRTKLRQVVLNLLDNAVTYTEDGSVTLAASAGRESVTLTVEDTGIGIAPDHRDRIFEDFFQVRPEENGSGGSGLGLSICRQLTDMLGGTIRVGSEEGAGSSFAVELPITWPSAGGDAGRS